MSTDTTTERTMSMAQLARLILDHLAKHNLPEPCSLVLDVDAFGAAMIRVQPGGPGRGLAKVAGMVLSWANTFTSVSVHAWRPPTGTDVHLHLDTMLSGPAGEAAVTVYAGTVFDPALFGPMQPNERRPVTFGQLATWAGGAG